jgi:hypothetical protein
MSARVPLRNDIELRPPWTLFYVFRPMIIRQSSTDSQVVPIRREDTMRMRTGIRIRPRLRVEYLSILLWENTAGWARSLACGAASSALQRLAVTSPKAHFFLSHRAL